MIKMKIKEPWDFRIKSTRLLKQVKAAYEIYKEKTNTIEFGEFSRELWLTGIESLYPKIQSGKTLKRRIALSFDEYTEKTGVRKFYQFAREVWGTALEVLYPEVMKTNWREL